MKVAEAESKSQPFSLWCMHFCAEQWTLNHEPWITTPTVSQHQHTADDKDGAKRGLTYAHPGLHFPKELLLATISQVLSLQTGNSRQSSAQQGQKQSVLQQRGRPTEKTGETLWRTVKNKSDVDYPPAKVQRGVVSPLEVFKSHQDMVLGNLLSDPAWAGVGPGGLLRALPASALLCDSVGDSL